MTVPVRVFVDLDPVFTQIRHLTDPLARERAVQHTSFFTVGGNVGRAQSTVPDDGLPWQVTRQPVVLDWWPVVPARAMGRFTTVMLWDSYLAVEYQGVRYGMKSESFSPYVDIPGRVGRVLELAVGSDSVPHALLRANGWEVVDSTARTRDPWTYQRYIQDSRAEFSVAKHGYVISRSGWFSDRSLAYLASGRPGLLQETGFSDWLETGVGIVPFSNADEAVAGIEDVMGRYESHCRAAREVAQEFFDARAVLADLIECAMSSAQAIER